MRSITHPPGVPVDISRFTSNELFGQPGIYPEGPPMQPAGGAPLTRSGADGLLAARDADDAGAAREVFASSEMGAVTSVPQVAAAVALLANGPASPLVDELLGGAATLRRIEVGPLAQPGRVLGDGEQGPRPGVRVLNERYASEHPGVVAPSLAHAICHHDAAEPGRLVASNAEEATLHGVLAGVHTWLLSQEPALADLGTELSRRQASLTITLLNARVPGSPRPGIVCPDGPGTIPGGNPDLQCPDLWSIPFTSVAPGDCNLSVPAAVRRTLALMADATAGAVPGSYDDELRDWLSANGCGGMLSEPIVDSAGRSLGLWG